MNSKLTLFVLTAFIAVIFEGFSRPVLHGLRFTDFQVISIQDKEVRLKATTENSGIKQYTNIICGISGDSISFEVIVLPNDRNVDLKYRASIKLK